MARSSLRGNLPCVANNPVRSRSQQVVKARGEAMAAAAAAGAGARPHGMLSVVGLADSKLNEVVAAALAGAAPGSVCQVANYLFPQVQMLVTLLSGCRVRTCVFMLCLPVSYGSVGRS